MQSEHSAGQLQTIRSPAPDRVEISGRADSRHQMAHGSGSPENSGNNPEFHRETTGMKAPTMQQSATDERSIRSLARGMMLRLQHRHYDE
jgi:hypothetical protein